MSTLPDLESFPADEQTVEGNQKTYEDLGAKNKCACNNRFVTGLILGGVFLAVAIATLVLCLGFRADYKAYIAQHNGYMDLINYANEHSIANLEGTVTGLDVDKETGLYAFTYTVVSTSLAEGRLDAKSPFIYTAQEINQKYSVGTKVRIAVEPGYLHQFADSVNMSYAEYDAGSYAPFKKAQTGYITLLIATCVALAMAFCFVGFAIQSKCQSKKDDEEGSIDVIKANGERVQQKEV